MGQSTEMIVRMLTRLWKCEEGVATVEYALLLALLVLAGIGVWTALGQKVRNAVIEAANAFDISD